VGTEVTFHLIFGKLFIKHGFMNHLQISVPAKFPVPGYAIMEKGTTILFPVHLFPAG
jgi:hypothetical protein